MEILKNAYFMIFSALANEIIKIIWGNLIPLGRDFFSIRNLIQTLHLPHGEGGHKWARLVKSDSSDYNINKSRNDTSIKSILHAQNSFPFSSVDVILAKMRQLIWGQNWGGGAWGDIWREEEGIFEGVKPWRMIKTGAVEMEAWDLGPGIATHELFN